MRVGQQDWMILIGRLRRRRRKKKKRRRKRRRMMIMKIFPAWFKRKNQHFEVSFFFFFEV